MEMHMKKKTSGWQTVASKVSVKPTMRRMYLMVTLNTKKHKLEVANMEDKNPTNLSQTDSAPTL